VPLKVLTVLLFLLAPAVLAMADDARHTPQLLLNAQRIRRLKRDRERNTARWVNFENRIKTAPDSPERGFELALYYAITGDETKGREAIAWALSHQSVRQAALILDWCAPLVSADETKKLSGCPGPPADKTHFVAARDCTFQQIASRAELTLPTDEFLREQFAWLMDDGFKNSSELYALFEWIYAVRADKRIDLRESAAHFFSSLPVELLLSAKPRELNSPDWMKHAAALALVAIDPNLPGSQFLQSWALEDGQTLREGPGVAYELLWADPYLPGVGYQNMESWVYDDQGRLYARSGWDLDSCWIEISAQGPKQENCPPQWQLETATFGHLTLIPMTGRCTEIPRVANNESVMVWKLKPGQKMIHGKGKDQRTSEADSAGIWRPGANVEGKVCALPH
jgi:hypothetical protein